MWKYWQHPNYFYTDNISVIKYFLGEIGLCFYDRDT